MSNFGKCLINGTIAFSFLQNILKGVVYLATTLLMGVLISPAIDSASSVLVQNAALITIGIVVVMAALGSIFTDFFSKIGGALFIALISLIVVSLVTALLGISLPILTWIGLGIFTLYIGYDTSKLVTETDRTFDNSISAAFSLYLDIMNIFLRILELLKSGD